MTEPVQVLHPTPAAQRARDILCAAGIKAIGREGDPSAVSVRALPAQRCVRMVTPDHHLMTRACAVLRGQGWVLTSEEPVSGWLRVQAVPPLLADSLPMARRYGSRERFAPMAVAVTGETPEERQLLVAILARALSSAGYEVTPSSAGFQATRNGEIEVHGG